MHSWSTEVHHNLPAALPHQLQLAHTAGTIAGLTYMAAPVEEVDAEGPQGWSLAFRKPFRGTWGLHLDVWRHESSHDVIIAFRGTTWGSPTTWVQNIGVAWGERPAMLGPAQEFVHKVLHKPSETGLSSHQQQRHQHYHQQLLHQHHQHHHYQNQTYLSPSSCCTEGSLASTAASVMNDAESCCGSECSGAPAAELLTGDCGTARGPAGAPCAVQAASRKTSGSGHAPSLSSAGGHGHSSHHGRADQSSSGGSRESNGHSSRASHAQQGPPVLAPSTRQSLDHGSNSGSPSDSEPDVIVELEVGPRQSTAGGGPLHHHHDQHSQHGQQQHGQEQQQRMGAAMEQRMGLLMEELAAEVQAEVVKCCLPKPPTLPLPLPHPKPRPPLCSAAPATSGLTGSGRISLMPKAWSSGHLDIWSVAQSLQAAVPHGHHSPRHLPCIPAGHPVTAATAGTGHPVTASMAAAMSRHPWVRRAVGTWALGY